MTDDEEIQAIVQQLQAAWNASDSKNFAAAFGEDANFIHIFGGQLDGRSAIDSAHRHIFDTIYKGSHASFTLRNVRFVRPDVAIAFTAAHLRFGEGSQTRQTDARPTLVLAKEQGKWQIVAFQNTRISEIP